MATAKNRNVVFSGLVKNAGRRTSAKKGCTRQSTRKVMMVMRGGPLDKVRLAMSDTSCTLPITMKGQTGRYVECNWVPA